MLPWRHNLSTQIPLLSLTHFLYFLCSKNLTKDQVCDEKLRNKAQIFVCMFCSPGRKVHAGHKNLCLNKKRTCFWTLLESWFCIVFQPIVLTGTWGRKREAEELRHCKQKHKNTSHELDFSWYGDDILLANGDLSWFCFPHKTPGFRILSDRKKMHSNEFWKFSIPNQAMYHNCMFQCGGFLPHHNRTILMFLVLHNYAQLW